MKLKEIFLVLYIFCFLFSPPIFSVNLLLILSIYSFLAIIFKYPKKLKNLFNKKEFKKIILIITIYFVVYSLSVLINYLFDGSKFTSNYFINYYSFLLNFPATIVCSIYLIFKCDDLKLSFDEVIRLFIFAGLVQAIIAIATLVLPSFRQWTLDRMLDENNARYLESPWIIARRFYGFSNNLLDLFGFGTGILAVLPLYYAKNTGKYKYLLFIPVLLIVPLLNSRSGLLIFALGLVMFIFGTIFTRKINILNYLKYFIILILILVFGMYLVQIFSPDTLTWIKNDFMSFTSSDTSGTATKLFDKSWWQLPPLQYWLLGTGHNVSAYSSYAADIAAHSDVGYINEMWKSGLIGSLIMFVYIIYITTISKKLQKSVYYKILFVFFLIASFIMLIKGNIFSYNPGNVIIYTLAIWTIYNYKKEESESNEK